MLRSRLFAHCTSAHCADEMGNFQFLNSVVSDRSDETRLDLFWSLRPIIYPLRIFGVDLQVARLRRSNNWRRRAFVLLGISVSILIISRNVFEIFQSRKRWKNWKSTARCLDRIIEYTVAIRNIVVSLVMLEMVSLFKWEATRKKMRKLERFVPIPAALTIKLRRVSTAAFTAILLLVTLKWQHRQIPPIKNLNEFR